MTSSLSLGNIFPRPSINSALSFLHTLESPHTHLPNQWKKGADCFVHGKDTLHIIHTFHLEGLPRGLGHAGFQAATVGSICNSSNGGTTRIRHWFSASGDSASQGTKGNGKTSLTATTGQMLLASSGQRLRMLLNMLHCRG